MQFYKMSRKNHNIRKKPIFSSIFPHAENFVPKRNFKILNLSKNTLQSLAGTNCTSDVQECTHVHYFVRIGTLFKGDTLRNYLISLLNAINSTLPLGGVLQKVKPSKMKIIQG